MVSASEYLCTSMRVNKNLLSKIGQKEKINIKKQHRAHVFRIFSKCQTKKKLNSHEKIAMNNHEKLCRYPVLS